MYVVKRLLNGKYEAEITLQDGRETNTFDSKEEAIKCIESGAKAYYNQTLRRSEILFLQERQVLSVVVETEPVHSSLVAETINKTEASILEIKKMES